MQALLRPPEGRKGVIVPGDEMVRLRDVRSSKLAAQNATPAQPPDVNAWFSAPSRGQKNKRGVDVVETTAEPSLTKVSDVTSRPTVLGSISSKKKSKPVAAAAVGKAPQNPSTSTASGTSAKKSVRIAEVAENLPRSVPDQTPQSR